MGVKSWQSNPATGLSDPNICATNSYRDRCVESRQCRRANDVANAARWLIETFPKLVESIPCGSVEVRDGIDDFDKPIKIVAFSTGGWSGQEALVNAVEHGLPGTFYLWSWRRGGHYEFRVREFASNG